MRILVAAVPVLVAVHSLGASIVGTVRDAENGAPLVGAIVALADLDRGAVSDSAGRYELSGVPAGPQHIDVRALGYELRSLHALVPAEGVLEINVSLRRRPLRLEAIEVRAPLAIRGAEAMDTTVFPDREMSIAAVRNHPVLAEPDVFVALSGGEVVVRPESPDGIHIRGGSTDQTAYVLDGVPVLSPYHAAGVGSAWNPDAISRLRLSSVVPTLAQPHALSGAVEGITRAPGARLRAQGSLSNTQARLTADGPLGPAGWVASVRSGLHDVIAPADEPSYLRGGTGDWLAKLEAPILGGRARLLGYGSANEITAARASEDTTGPAPPRNAFEWHSHSLGVGWNRALGGADVGVLAFAVAGDAAAEWSSPAVPIAMDATRRDAGLLATLEHRSRGVTSAELRIERTRTRYGITPDTAAGSSVAVEAITTVASGRLAHIRPLGAGVELHLGMGLALTGGESHLGPLARLQWGPSERLGLAASYARVHQFAQSLRNPESVVGNIFPVDVYMGAAAPGVPVARGDQGVIAADWRPLAGVRFGAQAYARRSEGLLLVAPRGGDPFATAGFAVGSAAAAGMAADAAMSRSRWGLVASYGWQRVRYEYGDSSYVPDHGDEHRVEGGAILFPTATTSVRLGAVGAFGRRTTVIPNAFEWESCNLLDQGCEFVGSPNYGDEPIGSTRLPPYFRLDVGIRKHWHMGVAGRVAMLEFFASASNVLGRRNLLTWARHPATGELVGIELRPQSLLVVGLDGRF